MFVPRQSVSTMINSLYLICFISFIQDRAPAGRGRAVDGEGGASSGDAMQDGRHENDGEMATRAQGNGTQITKWKFDKGALLRRFA